MKGHGSYLYDIREVAATGELHLDRCAMRVGVIGAYAQLSVLVASPGPYRAVLLQRDGEVVGGLDGNYVGHIAERVYGVRDDIHSGKRGRCCKGIAQLPVIISSPGPHPAVRAKRDRGQIPAGDHRGGEVCIVVIIAVVKIRIVQVFPELVSFPL